jgi:hypothetical protein
MKRTLVLIVVAIAILFVPAIASACSVCYGDPGSPMTKSSNNAIIFLLGIVGFVQLGFIALFWSFWRRAQSLRRRRESFRLLDGGVAH